MEDLKASKSFIIEKVRYFVYCSFIKLRFTTYSALFSSALFFVSLPFLPLIFTLL